MAITESWGNSVGLRARRPRTLGADAASRRREGGRVKKEQCPVDARRESRPSRPTIKKKYPSCDCGGTWKMGRISVRQIVLVVTVLSLSACAGPEPMLRSNAKVQLQGREISKLDVAVCQQKAEAAGLQPGTANRGGNMAAGAALGLVAGAAVGASSGLIGGATGVAIGAAAGGGLGLIIGLVGGAYKPLDPDPPYADAVVRCLIEKGYEVTGWQ
jgi:hypothetical protein